VDHRDLHRRNILFLLDAMAIAVLIGNYNMRAQPGHKENFVHNSKLHYQTLYPEHYQNSKLVQAGCNALRCTELEDNMKII